MDINKTNLKKVILLASILTLPSLCFASTGDSTFTDIVTQVKAYMGGSLGLLFVMLAFLGAAAAVVGMAPMKVMFPVFGLTIALHYGPDALESMFGATGDLMRSYSQSFTPYDLMFMLVASALFVVGAHVHKGHNNLNLERAC